MALTRYKHKRNFKATPEPQGKVRASRGSLKFVVQKHAASHVHYDFRLELDGVLKSWAIPKGPSMNPADKRLAMMVEDHPLDYRTFEGSIPEGNYGAGEVIVWDEGGYHAEESSDRLESMRTLRRGLEQGKLSFVLEGKKLRGGFTLIRTGPPDRNSWLLIKKRDRFAELRDVREDVTSVRSGRELPGERVAKEKRKAGAMSAPVPAPPEQAEEEPVSMPAQPMLASLVKTPFDDPNWLFEVKWDGYRAIAEVRDREVKLVSRAGKSFNERYAPVVDSLKKLRDDVLLDGEIVAIDENGRSHFQLLQNYQRTGQGNLQYYVFDILSLNGKDLRELPLSERKKILRKTLPDLPHARHSDHVVGKGTSFLEAARKQQLEGIMAKDMRSPYREGERSHEWLKIKTGLRQEAVIGGFTAPRKSRKHLGALILGVYEGDRLVYVGHAGGGFNQTSLREVREKLEPLIQKESPFANPPRHTNAPVTWVRPDLVCEVTFSEWTEDGIFRQPIFVGLREDKDPREVVREIPGDGDAKARTSKRTPRTQRSAGQEKSKDEIIVNRHPVKFTHPDKLYWPEEEITKGDLLDYYRKCSRYILPYLVDRPQSLHRFPNGIQKEGFFQKDVGTNVPEWLETAEIPLETETKKIRYLVCKDEASLVYMVNLGCIEMHPWFSRVGKLDNPDYLVLDLDPEGVKFDAVVETAMVAKKLLDRAGVVSFCKTSGATGLHIFVPLKAKYEYDVAKNFAHLIARMVNAELPKLTSLERSPDKRKRRVYIDYLQNTKGQTVVAPYSVRPRPGAPVSTPLEWDELKAGLDPRAFTIKTIFPRLKERGDLFKKVLGAGVDIEAGLEKLGDG